MLNNDAKRRVYGKNLAKKGRNVLFPVLFYSVIPTLMEKKNLSSKICFRFRLIYISKFIGQYIYSIYRNQSNLSYKKYSKNQRTNGPVNAHLISWPSKAQKIQNLDYIW